MPIQAPSSNHIQTFSGIWMNPVEPRPEDFAIEDMAHALANQCRFTGHVREFYSVAQHSVHVADYLLDSGLPYETVWAGLLHDASEAYISDLARPVKRNEAIKAEYAAIENRLMEVIAEKYGFAWPLEEAVLDADGVLLRTEQRDLMHGSSYEGKMLEKVIDPWPPAMAEDEFGSFYEYLWGKLGR